MPDSTPPSDAREDVSPSPPLPGGDASPVLDAHGEQDAEKLPPPPPSMRRQIIQLIAIPALIVLASVAIIYPIASMAGRKQSVEQQLFILDRGSGLSSDRWLAAYRIATAIPEISDPAEKKDLNEKLLRILKDSAPAAEAEDAAPEEAKMIRFLILSIAMLRQPGNLQMILEHAAARPDEVRHGVTQAIWQWHDREEARSAVPALIALVGDTNAEIRGLSASALGDLASPDDAEVVTALKAAMHNDEQREAAWDAAIALARLGDDEAGDVVVDLLLDREALSKLAAAPSRVEPGAPSAVRPDQVILSTLTSAGSMKQERVWDKIRRLADNDPNPRVQTAAKQLVYAREAGPAEAPETQAAE